MAEIDSRVEAQEFQITLGAQVKITDYIAEYALRTHKAKDGSNFAL